MMLSCALKYCDKIPLTGRRSEVTVDKMAAPMRVGMLNLTGRILLKPIKKTCVLGRFSHVGRTKYSPTSRGMIFYLNIKVH